LKSELIDETGVFEADYALTVKQISKLAELAAWSRLFIFLTRTWTVLPPAVE
jgi:hypothetical protein